MTKYTFIKFTLSILLSIVAFYSYAEDLSQKSDEFIPGLSIIDVIFNCGYSATESLLNH